MRRTGSTHSGTTSGANRGGRGVAGNATATAPMPAGRHARHATGAPHGTSASVTGAFQRLNPSVTGSFAALTDATLQPIAAPAAIDDAAPRPVNASPAVTASFERITSETAVRSLAESPARLARLDQGDGAYGSSRRLRGANRPVVAPRAQAASEPERRSRRMLVAVAVAVGLVVAGGGLLLHRLVTRAGGTDDADSTANAPSADADAGANAGAVTLASTTYTLRDNGDGTHALCATAADGEDGEAVAVAVINGEPARLIAYDGSIIIPESYAGGEWDVVAYTPGGDALATLVVDEQGQPVHGSGAVVDARVDGNSLVVDDTTGATTVVRLGA